MTELAIKKIDLFIGTEHTDLEIEFIKRHIYDAEPKINHDTGINLDDFLSICNRCHSHNGKVVGIETRADSTYPFFSLQLGKIF